jgi:hypothetical protein
MVNNTKEASLHRKFNLLFLQQVVTPFQAMDT